MEIIQKMIKTNEAVGTVAYWFMVKDKGQRRKKSKREKTVSSGGGFFFTIFYLVKI